METADPAPVHASAESIAVAIQANPGVYALLLGAGLSINSGIPSAWEVTNRLCAKLAICHGEGTIEDPRAWYRQRFKTEPTYSGLFEELSGSGVERTGLMRSYFEASEDDIDLGQKTPTSAHQAIARLVANGYVKLIVTTNFDHLLEGALGEVNIIPTIISTEEDAATRAPFVHSNCTILKIHGDFLDHSFRNTFDELSAYPPFLRSRLCQVLSEYGLVVCGWSGQSDVALMEALLDLSNRQYSTLYWTGRGQVISTKAATVIEVRNGHHVQIESADSFFQGLAENVEGLAQLEVNRSLTVDLAKNRAKVFVTNPVHRAKLYDLVDTESRRVATYMSKLFEQRSSHTGLEPLTLLATIERETETLRYILSVGCFFDDDSHFELWKRAIEQLLPRQQGYVDESGVTLYPALLAFYTVGIISRVKGDDKVTKTILSDITWQSIHDRDLDLGIATLLYPNKVLYDFLRRVEMFHRNTMPDVSYLFLNDERRDVLWAPVRELAVSGTDFERALDSFEYLLGANFVYERGTDVSWAPAGRSLLRKRNRELPTVAVSTLAKVQELLAQGQIWEPVRLGMFGGSMDKCIEVASAYNEILAKRGRNFL